MDLADSFVALFTSTNLVVACLWLIGFVLFSVEFFQPMHGVGYILGIGLLIPSFVLRMLDGSAGEAFAFVFVTTVLMFCVHTVALFTQKRDWLRVARYERANANNRKYVSLVGSVGIANTPIDLTGNVTIGDLNLMVHSATPIARGEKVKVTGVTRDKITVEKAD